MSDLNETARLLRVDQMIDEIVARRPAPPLAAAPADAPLTADAALVTELSALSVIDWPPDNAGDRIARNVALLGGLTGPEPPAGPRRSRSRRLAAHPGRWVAAGAGAAAAALLLLLAVAAPFGPGHSGRGSGPSEPPATSLRMHLVLSVSSPFRSSGPGPQADSIDCVTSTVCYAWDTGSQSQGQERTTDGGTTWRPLAALPGGRSLAGQNSSEPSCPTAEVCVGAAGGLALAVTTDGGAGWRIESLPEPPGTSGGSVDDVACGTARECVVHVADHGPGTFLSTVNGGTSWTAATRIPREAPASLWYLRCDPDGRCIGLMPTGTNTDGGIVAMRSADNGRTWAVSPNHPAPASDLFMASCGDARHCMEISDSGAAMVTSDAGITWQGVTAVSSSPDVPLAVSCATGLDCFVAVSRYSTTAPDPTGAGNYVSATVEATRDGGSAWTRISLPAAGGSPLAEVFPLSCPSRAGCIGVATISRGNEVNPPREIISSFPAPRQPVAGG
jgi:photosystem II stability/assembly factor-like uncharacterized protein